MNSWMYIVLLGLVVIVYARLLPKKEAAAPKNTVVQEIEDTIEHFAAEMDEQNKTILDVFARTKQDYEAELAKLVSRMEQLEKQKGDLSHELNKIHISKETAAAANLQNSELIELNREPGLSKAAIAATESLASTSVQETGEEVSGAAKSPVYSGLSMKARYADLFQLYDQGRGVEAIAKKLGMNKGEVNLIIQLSRQEERPHA
ncbi:hypothetical protein [Paenibacillus eucommiae]|uniref:hypothetical protein n=1 Tax=Paenibacillus eucommiae TaxID=1355755 RepID=UPI00406BA919